MSCYLTYCLLYLAPIVVDLQQMQGNWHLTCTQDGKALGGWDKGFEVTIQGMRITSTNPHPDIQNFFGPQETHQLNCIGITPWSKPKYISVMWSEGIYEVTKDRIGFCIKYHGQGVEGEAARRWKAPMDFTVKEGQGHMHWTFERLKK